MTTEGSASTSTAKTPRRVAILLVVGSSLLALGIAEAVARVVWTPPNPDAVASGIYATNPRGYYDTCGEAYCLKEKRPESCPSVPKTGPLSVIVGDSFTHGEGVRGRDLVAARVHVDNRPLLNCGRSGNDLSDVIIRARQVSRINRPSVLVYALVLNDFDYYGTNAQYKLGCPSVNAGGPGHDDYIRVATERWNRWEAEQRAESSWVAPLLSLRLVQWLWWNHLRQVASEGSFEWYRDCLAAGPDFDRTLDAIATLRREADHVVVMLWPLLIGLDDYPFEDVHRRLKEGLESRGLSVLDLLDTFRGQVAEALIIHPLDRHPNEHANQQAAEALTAHLTALGVRAQLSPGGGNAAR